MIITTHAHYDHIGGVADLKLFAKEKQCKIFSDQVTAKVLYDIFPYAFKSNSILYPAILNQNVFNGPFSIIEQKITIEPFKQMHGKQVSYGFRIGGFAYSTDVDHLDSNAYDVLDGVKVWIVDCLKFYKSPSHFSLDATIEAILKVRPERAILTHMCHDIDYNLLSKTLPSNISLAFDGMRINIF
jgi:phosphoribosyl 1,2-cyclic phosphate phosphodiesterase